MDPVVILNMVTGELHVNVLAEDIHLKGEGAWVVDEDDISWPIVSVNYDEPGWSIGPVAEA